MITSLDYQIESKNGCLLVELPSYIDMQNSHKLNIRIKAQLNDSIDRVVLNFLKVQGINSFIMGQVMDLRRFIMQSDRSLYLINVSEKCHEQLEAVNLDKVVNILDE